MTANSSYNPYLMCLINAAEAEDGELTGDHDFINAQGASAGTCPACVFSNGRNGATWFYLLAINWSCEMWGRQTEVLFELCHIVIVSFHASLSRRHISSPRCDDRLLTRRQSNLTNRNLFPFTALCSCNTTAVISES